MGLTLHDWHPGHTVHRVRLTRSFGRHFLSKGDPYPAGTECYAVMDDPERPGMADVQLPNGDLLRAMHSAVEVIDA